MFTANDIIAQIKIYQERRRKISDVILARGQNINTCPPAEAEAWRGQNHKISALLDLAHSKGDCVFHKVLGEIMDDVEGSPVEVNR